MKICLDIANLTEIFETIENKEIWIQIRHIIGPAGGNPNIILMGTESVLREWYTKYYSHDQKIETYIIK